MTVMIPRDPPPRKLASEAKSAEPIILAPAEIPPTTEDEMPAIVASVERVAKRKTPLERLYEAMANPKIPWAARIRAMGLAAEYVHAKQPQAIHITQETRLEAVVIHVAVGPWNAPTVLEAANVDPTN